MCLSLHIRELWRWWYYPIVHIVSFLSSIIQSCPSWSVTELIINNVVCSLIPILLVKIIFYSLLFVIIGCPVSSILLVTIISWFLSILACCTVYQRRGFNQFRKSLHTCETGVTLPAMFFKFVCFIDLSQYCFIGLGYIYNCCSKISNKLYLVVNTGIYKSIVGRSQFLSIPWTVRCFQGSFSLR